MMDIPFYKIRHPSYPSRPRNYPSASPIPVNSQAPPVRKVVSIPVHYVRSEPERSRSDSAVKIQKVFRGYLVRKSLKKISAIRREVDEIEKTISMKETFELIRRDSKERLKVNETLMGLLFRLDSVRGVDSGVRDCRKAVIKKAINLQEMVDAIVAADQMQDTVNADPVDGEEESAENLPADEPDVVDRFENVEMQDAESPEIKPIVDNYACNCDSADQTLELESQAEELAPEAVENHDRDQGNVELTEKQVNEGDDENVMAATVSECVESVGTNQTESQTDSRECVESVGTNQTESQTDSHECAESVGKSQTESQADSSENPQSLVEGNGDDENDGNHDCEDDDASEKHEKDVEIQPGEEKPEGNMHEGSCGGGGEDESKKSRELLEKMMTENEKMMGLLAELFERNERQTRMLGMLSQRVELLERAFVCEKLRRKKRRNAAGLVDCLESTQDTKKCGKKL